MSDLFFVNVLGNTEVSKYKHFASEISKEYLPVFLKIFCQSPKGID